MKNKSGFTLIEIIGVVTVLSIILIVAVPSLTRTLKRNEQNKYNDYINNLKIAAENYIVEQLKNGETINDNLKITLGDLIDSGYIKEVIENPENNKKLSRYTAINVTKNLDNTLLYNVNEIYAGEILDTCQQVEYIEGTGTQYIVTNIKPTNNTTVRATYDYVGNGTFLFGSQSSSDPYKSFGFSTLNLSYVLVSFGTRPKRYVAIENQRNQITTVELSALGLYINDNKIAVVGSYTFEADYELYIFANNNAGNPENPFTGKLYNLSVKENGVLLNDFVPCYRREDGEIGLCDLVENKFYENSGTDEFIKGADI